jgi:DNA-directed RNA polymerase subunit RPC12/RpoP
LTPSEKRKDQHLRRTYGITLEDWYALRDFQGGRCAICGRDEKHDGIVLTTDHSHTDPKIVRGLACRYCNHRQIGRNNNPERLRKIADYLEDPPAKQLWGERIVPKKKRSPRKKDRRKI